MLGAPCWIPEVHHVLYVKKIYIKKCPPCLRSFSSSTSEAPFGLVLKSGQVLELGGQPLSLSQPRLPSAPSSVAPRLGSPSAARVATDLPSSSPPPTLVVASDGNLLRNSAPTRVERCLLFYAGWIGFRFSALNNSGKITVIVCCKVLSKGAVCLTLHLICLPALRLWKLQPKSLFTALSLAAMGLGRGRGVFFPALTLFQPIRNAVNSHILRSCFTHTNFIF